MHSGVKKTFKINMLNSIFRLLLISGSEVRILHGSLSKIKGLR